MESGDDGGEGFARHLASARAGDESAFAAIWREHDPILRRFLAALADADDVAEVASTVWLEVVRGLGRFEGDAAGFRGWIFTIARSRLTDLRRARRRRISTADDPAALHAMVDGGVGPDHAVIDADATDAAIALIGRLPTAQAEVVLLRVIADLDVETTAKVLDKTPGAVRVLAHRGLARLAEILREEGVTR